MYQPDFSVPFRLGLLSGSGQRSVDRTPAGVRCFAQSSCASRDKRDDEVEPMWSPPSRWASLRRAPVYQRLLATEG